MNYICFLHGGAKKIANRAVRIRSLVDLQLELGKEGSLPKSSLAGYGHIILRIVGAAAREADDEIERMTPDPESPRTYDGAFKPLPSILLTPSPPPEQQTTRVRQVVAPSIHARATESVDATPSQNCQTHTQGSQALHPFRTGAQFTGTAYSLSYFNPHIQLIYQQHSQSAHQLFTPNTSLL